ncbi:MAG: hypothetical protein IJ017_05555 [Oscillospiraceae bacterium]|nr:hypothetical protein [Oscillospiraceae bacterium]
MYCKNCGNEVTVGYYCSDCGTFAGEVAAITVAEPLSDGQRLKRALTSRLFLAIAILTSVSVGIGILTALFGFSSFGIMFNTAFEDIPVEVYKIMTGFAVAFLPIIAFGILNIVSYWLTYIRNKKSEAADASGPRMIYILNKISVVVLWIFAVIFIIFGAVAVVMAIVSGSRTLDFEFEDRIMIGVFGFIFGLVGMVYVVMLLMYYRKFLKMFKQIIESAKSGVWMIDDAKAVYLWTLVLGIISAVGAITSGGITLVSAASSICLALWIKENFVNNA